MPPVGFREYGSGKNYSVRKAGNKMMNTIWSTIGLIAVIAIVVAIWKYTAEWRGQMSNAIGSEPVDRGLSK